MHGENFDFEKRKQNRKKLNVKKIDLSKNKR